MFVKNIFPLEVLEKEAIKKALWVKSEAAKDIYWECKTKENLIQASYTYNRWQDAYTDHRMAVIRAMTGDK